MARYGYPFVECDNHTGPQRGVAVCTHVLAGASVFQLDEASNVSIGIAICERCAEGHTLEHCKLMCEPHFQANQRASGN